MSRFIKTLTATVLLAFASLAQAASVNINTASADELANALNGIGLAKANAIVEFRDSNGAFVSIEDIVLVNGIGDALLERNREQIVIE